MWIASREANVQMHFGMDGVLPTPSCSYFLMVVSAGHPCTPVTQWVYMSCTEFLSKYELKSLGSGKGCQLWSEQSSTLHASEWYPLALYMAL